MIMRASVVFFLLLVTACSNGSYTANGSAGGGGGGSGGGGGGGNPTVAVAIMPAAAALTTGQQQTFTAIVTGTSNQAVTFRVQEGSTGGSITAAGVYTAPSAAGTYHVIATSQADTTKSSVATVTVTATSGNAAPTIDATFGDNGRVFDDVSRTDGVYGDVVVLANGKYLAAGSFFNGDVVAFVVTRHNADGTLDPTFGSGGKSLTTITTRWGSYAGMVLQPDGRIVLTGSANRAGTNDDFAVARINADGSADTTFGSNGVAVFDVDGDIDRARGVLLQPNGRILLVGGSFRNGVGFRMALVRVLDNGSLDPAFGQGGKALGVVGFANAPALQADGKIVIAGERTLFGPDGRSTDSLSAIARFNGDGTPDTTFGTAGLTLTNFFPANDEAYYRVALRPDGTIVAAGVALRRILDANDSLVDVRNFVTAANYGVAGSSAATVTVDPATSVPDIRKGADVIFGALSLQPDGSALTTAKLGFPTASLAIKLKPDLALDATFGTAGVAVVRTSVGPDVAFQSQLAIGPLGAVAVLADGRVLAAGADLAAGNFVPDLSLLLLTAGGTLDASFGTGGRRFYQLKSGASHAFALGVQADGRLIVGGEAYENDRPFALGPGEVPRTATLLRYAVDGTADRDFSEATHAALRDDDVPVRSVTGLQILSNGGIATSQDDQLFGEQQASIVRFRADGSLDPTLVDPFFPPGTAFFDTQRGTLTRIGTSDLTTALIVQPDGKTVAAVVSERATAVGGSFETKPAIALARLNVDGSLDASFGDKGVASVTAGAGANLGDDAPFALLRQPDGKLVVGGKTFNGTDDDFALLRFNSDGTLDTSFGNGGKVSTSFGSGDDVIRALVLLPNGKLVAAGSASNGADDDFALVGYNVDGTIDATFGDGGKILRSMGPGRDAINALVVLPDGRFAAAGSAYNGTDDDFALAIFDADGDLPQQRILITPLGPGDDAINALALSADGKLLAAGSSSNGFNDRVALVRYRP